MRPGSYSVTAPAKVNLGLAVLTRRGDGFHEIETLMATLDLADELQLRVAPAPDGTADAGEPWTIRLRVDSGELPGASRGAVTAGPDNLAYRAADAYLRARGRRVAVEIDLIKRVPAAAGLGGGSSDAAAVLRALAEAETPGEGPSPSELAELALDLGSDVPFFLSGRSLAVARGRGERLSEPPEPVPPPLPLVLVNPGLQLSAADAYRDLVGFTPRLRADRALKRLADGEEPGWSNGLQPGVLRAHPEVREVLGALRAAGLRGVLMSGSGPTCFGVAGSPAKARELAAQLRAERPGWWTVAALAGGQV